MLYYLHYLTEWYSPLRIFRYLTVRAFGGASTAFLLSLLIGPPVVRYLTRLKAGQPYRMDDVPKLFAFHGKKPGTPTMGGVIILASVIVSTVLWAMPRSGYIWLVLGTMCFMGGIGFVDDYLKVTRRKAGGMRARTKFLLQVAWAVLVGVLLWHWPPTHDTVRQLMVPFLKDPVIRNMAWLWTLGFLTLVIVGSTNAVNLTDGLDGLAIGCSNSVALAYLVMAYVAGHAQFAEYLQVPYVPGTGELAVFCACLLGAGLGFLWFNCHPARVFMGDTGSLSLGGAIAMVAILIKQELVLIIVGGVFVMEALSVLLQVASFKLTGRRIFKCAPLHHHFELLEKERAEREGRDVEVVETMITIRFWIVSILFAILGVATLKLR